MVWLAGLEELGDYGVTKVVEAQARESGLIAQGTPRRIPFARRLRWVQLVMLASAPQIVVGFGVSECVGAPHHTLHRVERGVVQWDHPLARFVLASAYVDDALLGVKVFSPYVLHFDTAH
jgi:hypothetical protein